MTDGGDFFPSGPTAATCEKSGGPSQIAADLDNFATGGYTFLTGEVEGQTESTPSPAAAAATA